MSAVIHTEADVAAGLAALLACDPRLRAVYAIAGEVPLRRRPDGLDLDALAELPADDAHRALTELHGVGPWTADIYLLFCLGHADAWPAGDLALQEAARMALSLKARPSTKDMTRMAEPWRPLRGVAAYLLWTYYRTVKRRDTLVANFVFVIKDAVPNVMIPVNPLGLTITYFREDQAFQ